MSLVCKLDRMIGDMKVFSNEYRPMSGISRHKDGPLYGGRVAILSLQSTCTLEFSPEKFSTRDEVTGVFLEPRSLLVFDGEAYWRSVLPATRLAFDSLFLVGGMRSVRKRTTSLMNLWPTYICCQLNINSGARLHEKLGFR